MNASQFHSLRRFVDTPSGRIAYVEYGDGPVALFVHGVPLNGFHWRHVMDALGERRRCIALDLMGLGYTDVDADQSLTFTAQAQMIRELLDALDIDQVDLVGNDSGGGIAQIFAAHNATRLRTLTLTNCDVHDHWPPPAVHATLERARAGTLGELIAAGLENPQALRTPAAFGAAYSDPGAPTDEAMRVYLEPLVATRKRIDQLHRYWSGFDNAQTVAIEPRLKTLTVPTQIVWALDDVFFGIESAHWLRDTLPCVRQFVELPGAKLFFAEDQPERLVEPLGTFWRQHADNQL